ncbi:hypothetical protein BDZ91DRAFT_618156, partial [Kalaharituber pfeilii]
QGVESEEALSFITGQGKELIGLATKSVLSLFGLASNVADICNTTTFFDTESLDR